jgi:hypothetical protein
MSFSLDEEDIFNDCKVKKSIQLCLKCRKALVEKIG